jgi:hypothetical protein
MSIHFYAINVVVTITLVDTCLFINNKGKIYRSREQALRAYFVMAERYDRQGLLSEKSCIAR